MSGRAPVWVSPMRQFGRPCVSGTRVPVECVVSELRSGASWDEVSDWYALDRDDTIGAAVVAALNPHGMLPRTRWLVAAWDEWAEENQDAWHHGRWSEIPEPPTDDEARAAWDDGR